MKVLFDYAAFVLQARGGVSRVSFELFSHLTQLPELDCKLFAGFHCNKYLHEASRQLKRHIWGIYLPSWLVRPRVFLPLNRYLFRLYAKIFSPDICHLTYFDTPIVPENTKVIVTVHDLIQELFPGMFRKDDPEADWKRNAISRSDALICISENTKKDVEQYFAPKEKPTAVIYHGNISPRQDLEPFNPEYPYLFYVGNRRFDYKNFSIILEALACDQIDSSMHLICFGGGGLTDSEIEHIRDLNLESRVHQCSGDDDLLSSYYAGAHCLVYPSTYEGFGLPPIEAMAHGCPVVSSNAPPMPEIIGDAGLYFNPIDAVDLCHKLNALNQAKRTHLIGIANKHVKQYDWGRTAEQVKDFYESLIKNV
jgi:glycosyltransferase involved in cell wall biosynthesis